MVWSGLVTSDRPPYYLQVLNSSFEGCLGRYGGAALFACGADIYESTFEGNEASGLFGAVVNGDLSDEERAEASLSLVAATTTTTTTSSGTGGQSQGQSQNYTCPPLTVSGTIFDANLAATGVGGAIASVDSSLSVFNSSLLDTVGGAIYFGTSDGGGRDQLDVSRHESSRTAIRDPVHTHTHTQTHTFSFAANKQTSKQVTCVLFMYVLCRHRWIDTYIHT